MPWRWRQLVTPKLECLVTRLHGVPSDFVMLVTVGHHTVLVRILIKRLEIRRQKRSGAGNTFWVVDRVLEWINYVKRSSWEADSCSSSQEILRSLCNQVYRCVHKIPPLISARRQISCVRALPSHFSKIYFNIILPSSFLTETLYAPLLYPHACYMPRPSRFYFDHTNNIFCWVQTVKLLVM